MGRWTNFLKERRLRRLEADLKMLRNKINFDPRFALGADDRQTAADYTRRICEYRVWSMGNSDLLREIYRSGASDRQSLNYFWRRVPATSRMLHSGIPGLISTKMATVLFGAGFKAEVRVYGEDGALSEEGSRQAQELLEGLCDAMNAAELFENGATVESWGGHVFYKFSHDTRLTDFPILEVADVTQAEAVKERGLTTAILFKHWYEHRGKKYRLDEIYTVNADQDAVIRYQLFRLDAGGQERPVPLDELPQTAGLRERMGLDENGTFTYTGLKGMLAFDKPNKTPSLEFPEAPYGASDYEGAVDSFDALDETYSKIIHELRTNRTIRYIPLSMIPMADGKRELDDDFTDCYVQVADDLEQDAENKLQITQIPDKTEDHLAKWRTALTTAINKAGLSPFALGITGLESINASAESQQERNKATLETRKEKLKKWKPFLEKLLQKALELNSWMVKNAGARQPGFSAPDLDFPNTAVDVTFGDYVIETDEKRVTTWGTAKSMRVVSTQEAVTRLHPDWDAEQIENEVNRIRYEEGMSLDTPDLLPGLDGTGG